MERNRVHRVEVRLTDYEEERLQDACLLTDSNRSDVVREALVHHTRWLIEQFGGTLKELKEKR